MGRTGADFPKAMESPVLRVTWVLAQGTPVNTTGLLSGTSTEPTPGLLGLVWG